MDETFGCFGWSVQYKEEKDILFCGLGIYDKENGIWVWRWSSGAEGNFEPEKSVASDALKRAGFLFGLGRELYSSPKIVITPKNDWETYEVDDISYDDKDNVYNLQISNSDGDVVYRMRDGKQVPVAQPEEIDREEVLRIVCGELKQTDADREQLKKFYYYYKDRCSNFTSWNEKTVRRLWDKWISK